MPANPNTAFSALTPLAASQANRFPRGLMGDASSTTTYVLTNTVADIPNLSVVFTAEANRIYLATFQCQNALTTGATTSRMRLDWDLSGSTICQSYGGGNTYGFPMSQSILFSTTAGSKTLKVRALYDIGAAISLFAAALSPMRLIVEDMGPY